MQSQARGAGRRYSLGVFVMRGQPVTDAHLFNIEEGLLVADEVLVAWGSHNAARRHDLLPFTTEERTQMLRLALTPEQNSRVHVVGIEDQGNTPEWAALIRKEANRIEPNPNKITLVGHSKDHTSFYLMAFPGWDSTNTQNYGDNLSATTFRKKLFTPDFDAGEFMALPGMHHDVKDWLVQFSRTPIYDHLVDEAVKCANDIKKYGKIDPETGEWVYGPYLAADFLCIHGDSVLLIERGNHPFKGCFALPGGFVHQNEDVVDAALREGSKEETDMKIPKIVLERSYLRTDWYSKPRRDPRGRVASASSTFYINPAPPANMTDPKDIMKFLMPPKVKGQDDAVWAGFKPIAWVMDNRHLIAFDHVMQIKQALANLNRIR